MTTLKIYRMNDSIELPEIQTEGSACFDLKAYLPKGSTIKTYYREFCHNTKIYSDETLFILPKHRYLIPTGLIFDIPKGYSVRLHPRSGISLKKGIALSNCEGIIDSDYVDPVFVILHCDVGANISHGERICQAELIKNTKTTIINIKEPPKKKTTRDGGFGSTGEK